MKKSAESPVIWDPALRIFHWLLAAATVGAWLLAHYGPLQMTLHFWLGYSVIALLVFRLVWGFAGPKNARFTSFVKGPGAVFAYARTLFSRRASGKPGHNPLGGWSVIAMLVVLSLQVATGLMLDPEDYINVGPLAEYVPADWNRRALGLHHRLGNLLVILIGLHVAAILWYRLWKREDLVTPMITGRRKD